MPACNSILIDWYVDQDARKRGEPGIVHSYMASLASAIRFIAAEFDPVWLMGSSAFAFRIFVNEILCPSAMSMFNWTAILPEAIEQAGYHCDYTSRMWNENDREKQRREQAHGRIVRAIDSGIPAIAWDVAEAEWGLIVGYDNGKNEYDTVTYTGQPSALPYMKLGRNGIDILSVAIPLRPNSRRMEKIIRNSLKAAVDHADQKEWIDERPKYQNGLAAYDLWAAALEKWALLIKAGKSDKIGRDVRFCAGYYASHYYSARCYAREYLRAVAGGNESLGRASRCYEVTASSLRPVWEFFSGKSEPHEHELLSLSARIAEARAAEKEGIELIRTYLAADSDKSVGYDAH
jgi:hypothetical protein